MAWKRGTSNNQAGVIRKGHIKEFLVPSSRDTSISFKLQIVEPHHFSSNVQSLLQETSMAYINFNHLPEDVATFINHETGVLYLHAHEHPTSVLTCVSHEDIRPGAIALNDVHRSNSKVCVGENELFTVYQGERIAYDARDGAMGDTELRSRGLPPLIRAVVVQIRLRHVNHDLIVIDAVHLGNKLVKFFFASIISLEEVYVVNAQSVDHQTYEVVCTVTNLFPEEPDDDAEGVEDEICALPDNYRGIVDADTRFFFSLDGAMPQLSLTNWAPAPSVPPMKDIVEIITKDDEAFPVKRKLLRPCIHLTSVVQAGRGKYKQQQQASADASSTGSTNTDISQCLSPVERSIMLESDMSKEPRGPPSASMVPPPHSSTPSDPTDPSSSTTPKVSVTVDACTFDRVLLYLEHEARGEDFKFDPLIAPELRGAAEALGVRGLQDVCDRVLGSFKERVRRTPIPLSEVLARNEAGAACAASTGRRGETLLLLSGMVLDITRWLDEHPGGSTIIPEQALNMDCTVFFEIYHASRQSFLYLKEFYIGELAEEDREAVPRPDAAPSEAFMEQLRRVTEWRLKPQDMIDRGSVVHKSF